MRRRWRQTQPQDADDALARPGYDDLRIQSAVLAYVIGEGHHDETIFELALHFSPDEGNAVERAVRDLVGGGILCIDKGKVAPRLSSLRGG